MPALLPHLSTRLRGARGIVYGGSFGADYLIVAAALSLVIYVATFFERERLQSAVRASPFP